MKVLFYPRFTDRAKFTDHYYRMHWYLYPFADLITQVDLIGDFPLSDIDAFPEYLDDEIKKLIGTIPIRIHNEIDDKQTISLFEGADVVLVHHVDLKQPARLPKSPHRDLLLKKKIVRVDFDQERGAGSFYLKLIEQFPSRIADSEKKSRQIFENIRKRCQTKETGYIFGTGPELARAKDHDYSDGVCIACNSMVRNGPLLERLQPPLFVVGDPIFHAGPSI
jgi:hypothetical protein